MSLEHWESYYREGAAVSCPLGIEPGYTLEVRDSWLQLFAALPGQARILDIGTGNGPVPVIAREAATALGRDFEIHGLDLARIDPHRFLKEAARLLAGVQFHAEVAAESLPFESGSFDAVTGQFALEHMDVERVLAEVARVLKPGGRAQFILQHRDSIIAETAEESLRHASIVLDETKVFRKLARYLEAERTAPRSAPEAWQEIVAAGQRLQQEAATARNSMLLMSNLEFLRLLFDRRKTASLPELQRIVERMEADLRASVRRLQDMVAVAQSAEDIARLVAIAEGLGFGDVHFEAQLFDARHLVGWRLEMTRV